jgi:hypothetical protein
LLACIYAYGHNISGRCEKALYDAAATLERAIDTIAYVASQCRSDIESKCAEVQPGEGRIAQYLADDKSGVSFQSSYRGWERSCLQSQIQRGR